MKKINLNILVILFLFNFFKPESSCRNSIFFVYFPYLKLLKFKTLNSISQNIEGMTQNELNYKKTNNIGKHNNCFKPGFFLVKFCADKNSKCFSNNNKNDANDKSKNNSEQNNKLNLKKLEFIHKKMLGELVFKNIKK
jgi:hypothetical protein